MRVATIVLAGVAASLGVGETRAQTENRAPDVQAIVAGVLGSLDEASHGTLYAVDATDPDGDALAYAWTFIPPPPEPGCSKFFANSPAPNAATWVHGEADGCPQPSHAHSGTVLVAVTDGTWRCTAVYAGSTAGRGPDPGACTRSDDRDQDGVPDAADNCPDTKNPGQIDTDRDGRGNACDEDDDNDSVSDGSDLCPLQPGTARPRGSERLGCPARGPMRAPKGQLTQDAKDDWFIIATFLRPTKWAAAGLAALSLEVPPLAAGIAFFAAAVDDAEGDARDRVADPPDPRFRQIARPQAPRRSTIPPGRGFPPAAAAAATALVHNMASSSAYEDAFLHAVERAQGATRARSAVWARRQDRAAATWALAAARLIERRPLLRARLVAALGESGRRTVTTDETDALRLAVRLGGLPAPLVRALRSAGVPPRSIRSLRTALSGEKPMPGAFSLAEVLLDPDLRLAERGSAEAFRDFAERVRRGYR